MRNNSEWGHTLVQRSNTWRDRLVQAGWARPTGGGPILPLLVGEDQQCLNLQRHLELSGLFTAAIRPPTVPEGSARLRLVLHRLLPDETLESLLRALSDGRVS